MTKSKIYANGAALRRALEDRLASAAITEKKPIQRLRRQVASDRLLARLFSEKFSPWVLKGGYAMELRVGNARGTRDIDLAVKEKTFFSDDPKKVNAAILAEIRQRASLDLKDYFVFVISDPIMDLNAAPYGGVRFHVEAQMNERTFEKFHLDVGIGDIWIEPQEKITGPNWLEFAGISSVPVMMIPYEQQFAEKIHAYTLPREGRVNSRVKDLVDLVLLIDSKRLNNDLLKKALSSTFERRKTHSVPRDFPPPPEGWKEMYAQLAKECHLDTNMQSACDLIKSFLIPVLIS